MSAEKVSVDQVSKQVARLSVLLKEECSLLNKTASRSKSAPVEDPLLVHEDKVSQVTILDSEPFVNRERGDLIILSDDEKESDVPARVGVSNSWSTKTTAYDYDTGTSVAEGELKADSKEKDFDYPGDIVVSSEAGSRIANLNDRVRKTNLDHTGGAQASQSPVPAEPSQSRGDAIESRDGLTNCFSSRNNSSLIEVPDGAVNFKEGDSSGSLASLSNKAVHDLSMDSACKKNQSANKAPKASGGVIKDIVCDTDDDAWKFSFFKPPKPQHSHNMKPSGTFPKRQVIQLSLPLGSRAGSMRLGGGMKRFQPPRLDDWYRPILELDFFAAVGLASGTEKDSQSLGKLKEVPVCFQSPDVYFEIFRPLVLEEFKAQLQSSYQEMASSEELCSGSLSVLSVERIDDFHVVRFVQDDDHSPGSRSLMENDLILLTRQPLQNSTSDIHSVGKVFHT